MFFVTLRFSNRKDRAAEFMDGHKAWLQQGFADGVFLLAGSIKPQEGGAIIAHGLSVEALNERLSKDPFVAEDVVTVQVLDIEPSLTADALTFMRG